MAKNKENPAPRLHRQTKLAVYGEGDWDEGTGRYIGCMDVAEIRLVGFSIVPNSQLDAMEAELAKREEDRSITANQKTRLLEMLHPHLDAQNDIAIDLARILTERDPTSLWCPQQPNQVGWYWYKDTIPGLVQVVSSMVDGRLELCIKGGMLTHAGYKETFHPVHLMKGMWCGPILPPNWVSI